MVFEKLSFKKKSVKEVFVEMKDLSELMVDLSFYSLFFDNKQLADEVLELEKQMDELEYDAIISTILAVRNYRDAKKVAPLTVILGAIEDISNGAGDIAKIVKNDVEIPEEVRRKLSGCFEPVISVDASEEMVDKRFVDIFDEDVELLALFREGVWKVGPENLKIAEGDKMVVRGPADKLRNMKEDKLSFDDVKIDGSVEEVVDILLDMRELSELSIDLSFNAVLSGSEFIAKEVVDLEEIIDQKLSELQEKVLSSASEITNPLVLKGVLQLGYSLELITDASLEIGETVLKGFDVHPVFDEAVKDSRGFVVRREIEKPDFLEKVVDGISKVKAVKKHGYDGFEWVFSPEKDFFVEEGDVLILKTGKIN